MRPPLAALMVMAMCGTSSAQLKHIRDKALVVWVSPANLGQCGSGVLTLEQFGEFDSIVLGEVRPRTWMAGSDHFRRTERDQSGWPEETAQRGETLQIVIVYKGNEVTLYRNGDTYAQYTIDQPLTFASGQCVLIGVRHRAKVGSKNSHFAGAVEEARVYDRALTAAEIGGLKLGAPGTPPPLGMWTFEDGTARDVMGYFGEGELCNGAAVRDGRLYLDGEDDYMETKPKFEPLGGKIYPDTLEAQIAALKTDEQLRGFRENRSQLAADPYRPLYHFSVPGGNMNDPNGLCQWRGKYHLFYQFVPRGDKRVRWGHTVSDDLVHWEDLPIAIYPTTEKDCFSGQSLVESDRVIAIYHGTQSGNSVATASDPLLLNWKKHPNNPVIPITNGEPYRVFDPCIWKEEDGYYALSGTFKDGANTVDCRNVDHLFRSRDLAAWEYLGPLIEDGFWTEPGEDGAVPNFWPIGNGKHMLLFFSHKRAGQYYIGSYDNMTHRFTPESHGRMNYGPVGIGSLHAPSATIDDKGRYLAFFNMKPAKSQSGWVGIMTLPRHLSLNRDNSLRIAPVIEMESLRFDHRHADSMSIPANRETPLDGIRGKAMEIDAVIEPGGAREAGLSVFRSPDGAERTRISLYRDTSVRVKNMHSLQIDVSLASLRSDVRARPPEIGPLMLEEGEPLRLRVFIDRSIVEVFANGRQCLTVRAYPEREDSSGVSVFARGSDARLVSLDAWQMRGIWPELKSHEGH